MTRTAQISPKPTRFLSLVGVAVLCCALLQNLSASGLQGRRSRIRIAPLLIDLDANGFDLTSVDEGVMFDLDGDGTPEQTAWTSPRSRDAFLALDVIRTGRIENGRKLFGGLYGTENGFTTLARFEQDPRRLAEATGVPQRRPGKPDALIDSDDPLYDQLILWIDANHNGKAEPSEMRSPASEGVVRIFVGAAGLGTSDLYGNVFEFVAQAVVMNTNGVPVATEVRSVQFVSRPVR